MKRDRRDSSITWERIGWLKQAMESHRSSCCKPFIMQEKEFWVWYTYSIKKKASGWPIHRSWSPWEWVLLKNDLCCDVIIEGISDVLIVAQSWIERLVKGKHFKLMVHDYIFLSTVMRLLSLPGETAYWHQSLSRDELCDWATNETWSVWESVTSRSWKGKSYETWWLVLMYKLCK